LAEYLKPTASSPNDGIVLAKAREIVGAHAAPLEKARAIYDWIGAPIVGAAWVEPDTAREIEIIARVATRDRSGFYPDASHVDNTFRRAEARGCGLGNIAFMLESGDLGGKCADINSLFVGLARAAGLPARDFFGIRVADSKVTKSLGKSGDITKAQHCRAEVYIENQGWLPVDPADVRKVALEEDIPVDSDKIKILRERLFGSWEMNWVGFNYSRDFTLPGQQEGFIGFLMYPYAETAEGIKDSLDPDAFVYTITSNEIA
jgi:transglutaminase-like putative cysteine protease